jgi:hypothetical protein
VEDKLAVEEVVIGDARVVGSMIYLSVVGTTRRDAVPARSRKRRN